VRVKVGTMVDKYVQFFKALSDATRQEILRMLEEHDMNVTEICEEFENMSQPTISHHLQILRISGLVDTRKDGKLIYYYIKRDCIEGNCQEFFRVFKIRVEIE